MLPVTDDGTPARFYPYFYTTHLAGYTWGEGTDAPGLTANDFGKLIQFGSYDLGVYYTSPTGPENFSSVFMHQFPQHECPAVPRFKEHRH